MLMVAFFGFEHEFGSIPRLQIWLWLEVCKYGCSWREKSGDEGERWAFRWQGNRDMGGGAPALGWWGVGLRSWYFKILMIY